MGKPAFHKKLLFVILIVIITIPLTGNLYESIAFRDDQKTSAQYNFNRPLRGSYILHHRPEWHWQNWFSGSYQDTANLYIEENILFRNFLVRLYNQLNYSLFQKNHADVITGKSGVLFERMDIEISRGREYLGIEAIREKLKSIKKVQDLLASQDKSFLMVFAPSKAIVKRAYLPDEITRWRLDTTNYEMLAKGCRKSGIHSIDMNQYFLSLLDISPYPLYPQLGSHWTSYGMALAADTIFHELEVISGKNIRDFEIDTVIMALQPAEAGIDYNSQDYDLSELLNLRNDLEQDPLPYPHFKFSAEGSSYNFLLMGDSYYWQLYLSGIVDSLFRSHTFWFYNSTVYENGQQYPANDKLFAQRLEEADFIVIMQGIGGLRDPGFGLVEKAFALETQQEVQ